MKIAFVVHGRFWAFDLGRALLQRGHDVAFFTNYPRWTAERFGLPRDRLRSFWPHGILARAAARLPQSNGAGRGEAALHRLFGSWASAALARESWDVIHPWSGVAEETLRRFDGPRPACLLTRGSSHVRTQARLLREEELRTGVRPDQPSPWMIEREEREYGLARQIVVLSSYAYRTFIDEGVPAERLAILPLGAQIESFRPAFEVIEARRRRILAGEPLRVLYVGPVSFRKGMWDLAEVIRSLGPEERFRFQVVGAHLPEVVPVVDSLRQWAVFTPKQPQADLPRIYEWGDVFLFPTIEDGYAVVLAQAAAAGLPIITTTNCSGPDLVREGETGWVMPIRNPEALIERLRWCDTHRKDLSTMLLSAYHEFRPRDWAEVAADFEALCEAATGVEAGSHTMRSDGVRSNASRF